MTKHIEIYKFRKKFISPLRPEGSETVINESGDLLLIIDEHVWIQDKTAFSFSEPLYDAKFVRINPIIFKLQK